MRYLFGCLFIFFQLSLSAQAYQKIHNKAILIDTHNDFLSKAVENHFAFDADLKGTEAEFNKFSAAVKATTLGKSIAQEIVALDGKALRRALKQGQSTSYIVHAWACENGLALGQLKVDDKSNEITVVP